MGQHFEYSVLTHLIYSPNPGIGFSALPDCFNKVNARVVGSCLDLTGSPPRSRYVNTTNQTILVSQQSDQKKVLKSVPLPSMESMADQHIYMNSYPSIY